MNSCFNFSKGCNNPAITEYCPKCLSNGGIYKNKAISLKPLKRIFNSLAVVVEPKRTKEQYLNLYSNGYIYLWSAKLGLKKK